MNISNPVYTEFGRIDCEINHPEYGWIPFTSSPDDPEQHGRDIYLAALATEPASYIAPVLTPEEQLAALPPVSHAQIIAALIDAGILTESEGMAWITGTLPASVEAMITQLPAEQQVIARLRAIRPTYVSPTDPMVGRLAILNGNTLEDLIGIFVLAASL